MTKHRWNGRIVLLTLLGGAFLLGGISPALAEEAPRPGWSLMSPEEVAEHRRMMRTLEGDERQQYREAHREAMRARAAEQGVTLREGRGPDRAGMTRYKGADMKPGVARGKSGYMGTDTKPGMARGKVRHMHPGMGPRMGRGTGPCTERGAGLRQGYGPGMGRGPWMGPRGYW